MRKTIDPELPPLKAAMEQWQPPNVLAKMVDEAHKRFGSAVVTANKFKFWREARNAADFAALIGAEKVRRCKDDPPDVELLVHGKLVQVEICEALVPGRKRHDEYRQEERIKAALKAGTPLDDSDLAVAARFNLPTPRNAAEAKASEDLADAKALTEAQRQAIANSFARNPDHRHWISEPDREDGEVSVAIRLSLDTVCRAKASKGYDKTFWLLVYLNPGQQGLDDKEIETMLCDASSAAKTAFSEVWIIWNNAAYQTWHDGGPGKKIHRLNN